MSLTEINVGSEAFLRFKIMKQKIEKDKLMALLLKDCQSIAAVTMFVLFWLREVDGTE